MTTVYDGTGVVNPDRSHLGENVCTLYDWLRSAGRKGRMRHLNDLTPRGLPRYEQIAGLLRRRIFDGDWPERASSPSLAVEYGVSQTAVQKAFKILEREGLLNMESGRRTTLAKRSRWLVVVEAHLPAGSEDDLAAAAERVFRAFTAAAGEQPAVTASSAERAGGDVYLQMTVESASLSGAVTAALSVAQQGLGPLPMAVYRLLVGASVTARPA